MQAIRDYQRMNCWAEQDQLDTSSTKRRDKELVKFTKQIVRISYGDFTFSSDFTAMWST